MRLVVVAILVLAAFAAAPAHGYVGAPETHGPDPASVGAGPQAPVLAKGLPATWCGTPSAADATANELQNGEFRYHAVYMLAADSQDRFAGLAGTIQADAFGASALLESSYGRAIRFDMGTDCGPQYLDITVVRLRETAAQMEALGATPTGTFDAVSRALDAAGLDTIKPTDTLAEAALRTRNYVVWLDAPAPEGSCGQASIYDDPSRSEANLNNLGGKVAIVFRGGQGGAFCSSNAVRHEIAHNLGALQPAAPNAFDGSHCDDAYEDTMCYSSAPRVAGGERGLYFDYGNDDYWDPPAGPPLPWWTVGLNRFLCPDAGCNRPAGAEPEAPGPPVTPPAAVEPQATERRARARGRVRLRARRARRARRPGVWRVRLRASGEGRGVVLVRCRRRRHGQVRTVLSRTTRLPRSMRRRVRCGASRPRAKLLLLTR